MSTTTGSRLTKPLALGAMVVGLAAGSYGVASAATGSTTTTPNGAAARSGPPGAAGHRAGGRHSGETALTGDALAKVTAIAQAKVPGGTVVRVETDADGVAAYEAHMTRADGTRATVYVDASFQFVSTSTR